MNSTTHFALLSALLFVTTADAAIQLTASRSANNELTLTWEGTGLLERAASVQGPWEPVAGAVSGWKTNLASGAAFFRVRVLFPLRVNVTGAGTVRTAAQDWECRTTCEHMENPGQQVRLSAIPDAGSVFAGWSGDASGTGDCVLLMDAPKQVTATFNAAPPPTGLTNGDFELGPTVGWTQQPGNLICTVEELGVPTYSGRYAAWVGFHPDNRKRAVLSQVISLPNTTPLYLNFALWLYSEELCDPPWWDTFGVYADGEAILENSHLCSGNTGGDGWRRISLNISAYAGLTGELAFAIDSVDTLASVALIDDVFISNAPW